MDPILEESSEVAEEIEPPMEPVRREDPSTSEESLKKASQKSISSRTMNVNAVVSEIMARVDVLAAEVDIQKEEERKEAELGAQDAISVIWKGADATIQKIQAKIEREEIRHLSWVKLWDIIADFKISRHLYEQLVFREKLLVATFLNGGATPEPVGGLSIDIQPVRGGPFRKRHLFKRSDYKENKFLVHLSSELDVGGKNGGSRITAFVDRNLQTLEEKRTEYIHEGEELNEQRFYISAQENCYFVRQNRTKESFINPKRVKNLICEGANFILMRYMALTRVTGTYEMATTYINGDLCRNIYECEGPFAGIVNDRKLDLCKINRTIIEECGIVHRCTTILTLHGQIVKQEWEGCDYVLHINPLAEINDEKPKGNERILLTKSWITDMELVSRYMDHKTESQKIVSTYLEDYQDVKDLIKDYMSNILLMKPEDVLDFTARHFLGFAPHFLPRTEYYEASRLAKQEATTPSTISFSSFYKARL